MLKSVLRKQILRQRSALSEADFNRLNQNLLAQFKSLDFSKVKTIHIFLPIVKNNEPNTFVFIDWLQNHHPEILIAVSKSDFKNHTMSVHPYLGKEDLIANGYYIPEPKTSILFKDDIDMVLVPLLTFDKRGYRVGYGKGFYDRFLARKDAVKVGISLFEPVAEISDVHLDDIKLDFCLSPKQIYRFVV